MKNILLTGHTGVGKTTLLYKIIERLNLSIGGFKVDRYINQIGSTETKTFILSSLFNGIDNFIIAKLRSTDSSFDMNIFPEEFEKASIAVMNRSIMERDVIVLDEIGVMESNSPLFKQSIIDSFESPKLVIGILKDRDAPFLNSIRNRDDVDIINVTCENRSSLLQTILDMLQNHFKGDNVIRNNYFSNDHNRIYWYDKALSHKNCEYPKIFLDEISKYVDIKGKSVLDIGSGTGAFALPLSKSAEKVTALDFSINMREFLQLKCIEEDATNIELITSPFETILLSKHNIIINAFASSVTKSYSSMEKIINLATDYVFIISHHEKDKYKFGANILEKKLGRSLLTQRSEPEDDIHTMLSSFNVDYEYKEINFSFPQYFEDMNDAINFFKKYFNLKDLEVPTVTTFLNETLIKIDNGFIYPENRCSRFIVIKK